MLILITNVTHKESMTVNILVFESKNHAEWSEAKKFWKYVKRNMLFTSMNTVKSISLCLKNFPCVITKFPVFSLSGKSKNQIPCCPCAVVTLNYVTFSDPPVLVRRTIFHPCLKLGHINFGLSVILNDTSTNLARIDKLQYLNQKLGHEKKENSKYRSPKIKTSVKNSSPSQKCIWWELKKKRYVSQGMDSILLA